VTGIQVKQITQQKTTTVVIDESVVPGYSYSVWDNAVNPFFIISDKNVVPLGSLKDTAAIAFGKKDFLGHTSWFMALPPANSKLWRYVFQQAGANIYDADEDIFYSGHGILSIHTLNGGTRNIKLKTGKTLSLILLPNSTTLIDSQTGEIILK
ncbi:MAG: hypothetical protein ABIO55_18270, partial [Ginsengibacter sp.]